VIHGDQEVLKKIAIARQYGKPIDGHAPGLRGKALDQYLSAGISTDHECFSAEEALDKLDKGMKILIREGSAAKNFEALISLLPEHFENMMFCSDDKHPDELLMGHINQLVVRALQRGMDLYKVLQVACLNPIEHYGLDVGKLRVGDPADFIVVKDLKDFEQIQTYVDGQLVAEKRTTLIESKLFKILNSFNTGLKVPEDFMVKAISDQIQVIECLDGELITNKITVNAKIENQRIVSDIEKDILKIVVVNRYKEAVPTVAFIKNFGLKEGAIASSVAHDSHNIVAVGVDDDSICKAINSLVQKNGGISAVSSDNFKVMPLPVAGIMSDQKAENAAVMYSELDAMAKSLGSTLSAPYMSLSFMALLVIPSLKLSDKGLFDGSKFEFTSLYTTE
jgi:adenine deaminase